MFQKEEAVFSKYYFDSATEWYMLIFYKDMAGWNWLKHILTSNSALNKSFKNRFHVVEVTT